MPGRWPLTTASGVSMADLTTEQIQEALVVAMADLDIPQVQMGPSPPAAASALQDDLGRKKHGRPRMYKPDGSGFIPSPSPCTAIVPVTPGSGGGPSSEKPRGRPPGSGKMQQLLPSMTHPSSYADDLSPAMLRVSAYDMDNSFS
ncbi:hypothetical protein ZWY2020_048118 [Hordeum vulgare]|nr:hypothetical protein ZWY2020_048118 [Hordeum vulgare]